MVTTVTKSVINLNPVKAPALPLAPATYNPLQQEQLLNALRLYFRAVDNYSQIIAGPMGGRYINNPYGAFQDNTDQHDGSTTIPYAMRLAQTDYSNGVTVEARSVVATASISTTTMSVTAITSGRFYPGMILSGTGVTSGTYVYLQLSSTATAIANTPTYASGGASGQTKFIVNDVTGIEVRQFVSGTGVPANTRVVAVDTTTKEITLSANFTTQAAGTYTFRPWGYQGTYSVSPSQTVGSTTITGISNSKITVQESGVYNIQFSAQFTNTDSTIHDVDIWFAKNDLLIPASNSVYSITGSHGGIDGHMIAALNYVTALEANDYIEILWHTSNSAVYIEALPTQTSPIRPATPSVIVTVTFVSSLTV